MGSVVTPARAFMDRATRFNPLSTLTPALLTQQLAAFEQGYLWQIGRTWDAIAKRDDKLPALIGKRLGALARYGWEVLAPEDDPEAQAHKATIEHTLNHLTAVDAVDENDRGGFSKLLRFVGRAIAHRYAPQELLYTPVKTPEGWQMNVETRAVPLWFFENTTGRLRFLETPGAANGVALTEGAWLIPCGAGLMEPCSVLYMFKRLPLSDLLNFCESFGLPFVFGQTNAAKDSDPGRAMQAAMEALPGEMKLLLYGSGENKVELISGAAASGQLPMPALIENCNRGLSILWRGADLSTMSAGGGTGQGASLQGDESELLEQDDAMWASELIQEGIIRTVIAWKFDGAAPKAYLRVKTKQTPDTRLDLEIVKALIGFGFPVAQTWAGERFGIPMAKDTEDLLGAAAATAPDPNAPEATPAQPGDEVPAENDRAAITKARTGMKRFLATAQARVAAGLSKDLKPLQDVLSHLINGSDAELRAGLLAFRVNAPSLLRAIAAGGHTEKALTNVLATAAADGLAAPKAKQ